MSQRPTRMTPLLPYLAVAVGLALLVWSADRFVAGAAGLAGKLGMPPLLIGMIVVGFGTSAPEMVVSAISALQGNPALALGNAYGSNIANIGLILGCTALVSPIAVHSRVLRKELPLLLAMTLLSFLLFLNGSLMRWESLVLLCVFLGVLGWTIHQGRKVKGDALAEQVRDDQPGARLSMGRALFLLALGLVVLVASSRLLVWGAVSIATGFGVGELVIGLTIVAVGTSLPELASSVMAALRGEHDLALGNILGSNMFNTLAVVGIAGAIQPMELPAAFLWRDGGVALLFTASLFLFGFRFRRSGSSGPTGRINRLEGGALLVAYAGYTVLLLLTAQG